MQQPFDQVLFTGAEFADNPEPRCACLLLLDTSGSMRGYAIDELNAGLQAFSEELKADALGSLLGHTLVGEPWVVDPGERSLRGRAEILFTGCCG